MTNDEEKNVPASNAHDEHAERRREKRYQAPDAYKQYVRMQVRRNNEFAPAILGNFSRSGILFESPVSFSQGERAECVISLSLLLSRDITFGIEVKYCYADHGSYLTGATIDTISDKNWFDVFVEVYDYIVQRKSPE